MKTEYTDEQIAQATALVTSLSLLDIDELREVWAEHKDLLEISVEGTTLKDAISNRVADLKASE